MLSEHKRFLLCSLLSQLDESEYSMVEELMNDMKSGNGNCKEDTKKKIPDEILERYPYAKWIEALDGITGLEWAKVQHCIDQRFKHLSSDYEKKTALSVSDMDLNWYLF